MAGTPVPDFLRADHASDAQSADDRPSSEGAGTGSSTADPEFTNWPVLLIPGVATLGELSGAGVVFGAGLSEGYGRVSSTAPGDPSGSISVVQPYMGVYQAGERHKLMLDYSPTVDLYNQDHYDGSVLQRGDLRFYTDISRRWRWVFAGFATYGADYLRELSGAGLGEFPGWLTFSIPTDKELGSAAWTGFKFRHTPRQEFSFMALNSYGTVHDGPHYDTAEFRVQMTNFFGRYSDWYVYSQTRHYSSQPNCEWVGGGGGIRWDIRKATSLEVEGGPEFETGQCVHREITSNFAASIGQRISPWTVFYLSAGRDLIEPYELQSRWTDIYTARLLQKTSRSTYLEFGSGYAVSSSFPGQADTRYRGFMAFSNFHWRLGESWSFVGSYKYFKHDIPATGFRDTDSWVFASLVWHPLSRGMRH